MSLAASAGAHGGRLCDMRKLCAEPGGCRSTATLGEMTPMTEATRCARWWARAAARQGAGAGVV